MIIVILCLYMRFLIVELVVQIQLEVELNLIAPVVEDFHQAEVEAAQVFELVFPGNVGLYQGDAHGR